MTTQTLNLLAVMLTDPAAEWYGFDLADRTKIKTGTLYPILARLEGVGWLRSHWENVDPHRQHRPRRRLYALTPNGWAAAQHEVADQLARLAPSPRSLAPKRRPAPKVQPA
jgi:PadR family transcriptional regulator, regulatory protein PadR